VFSLRYGPSSWVLFARASLGGLYERHAVQREIWIPTQHFLGPRANVELVHKFHVALHASHAALPMLTSKFRPKVAPHINIKISPNAALPRLITKFRIVYERSKTLLNFSPCSTLHLTFSTSKRLTFTLPTFTRRTSGHCLGTFVAANINLCSPPLKGCAYRYSPPPPTFSSLSPSVSKDNLIFQDYGCQGKGRRLLKHR
jgi:hypothetical protein